MGEPWVMLLIGLGVTLLLLFLNALFVAAEYSLVKMRRSRVKELIDKGDRSAKIVQRLQKEMGTTIAGTQLGITLASLAIGWIGQDSVHQAIQWLLSWIPLVGNVNLPVWTAFALSFATLSMFHVIIGEQVAKSIALRMTESTALRLAGPLRLFCRLTFPLLWVMNGLAGGVLRLLGLPESAPGEYAAHSPEEFELLFEASRKAGQLDRTSTDLLQRALDLKELTARQVMVPRTKMIAIPDTMSLPDVLAVVSKTKRTRLLVYRGNDDNVVGVLNTLDLFDLWLQNQRGPTAAPPAVSQPGSSLPGAPGQGQPSVTTPPAQLVATTGGAGAGKEFRLSSYLRQVHFVPDSMAASKILEDMRAKNYQVAIVLDEFGGTDGVITLKDLVEQLVGEIWDEHDTPNAGVTKLTDTSWRVKGDLTLLEAKKEIGAVIESGPSITVAGAITEHLGRQPEIGDVLELGGFRYKVVEMTHRVISVLEVEQLPASQTEEAEAAAEGEEPKA
jgi:CBS domain containing-hemolysin-like protein